jgi:hypothetical protein
MQCNVLNTEGAAMLPVVVIGADDSVREAFEALNGESPVYFWDRAEDAAFGLGDIARSAEQLDVDNMVPLTDDGERWECNVVYGPLAFGPLVTAQDAKLPHTGWTIVADSNLKDTQREPRRVSGQVVQGEEAQTMVWEVMAKVAANFVVDVALASGDASMVKLAQVLNDRPTP